jgi:hypothetical protein
MLRAKLIIKDITLYYLLSINLTRYAHAIYRSSALPTYIFLNSAKGIGKYLPSIRYMLLNKSLYFRF